MADAADKRPVFWPLLCDMAAAEAVVSANPRVPARPHAPALPFVHGSPRNRRRRGVASCFLRSKLQLWHRPYDTRSRGANSPGFYQMNGCQKPCRASHPRVGNHGHCRPISPGPCSRLVAAWRVLLGHLTCCVIHDFRSFSSLRRRSCESPASMSSFVRTGCLSLTRIAEIRWTYRARFPAPMALAA
jgi:hypothetical protein